MGSLHKLGNMYMRWVIWSAAMLLLYLAPEPSWARGGGGCLAEGTLVLTPEGVVAIEKLKKGDAVWSIIDGKFQKSRDPSAHQGRAGGILRGFRR